MQSFGRIGFLVLISITSGGCGLIPKYDRPPTNNECWIPDMNQSKWNRLLFGTRWEGERAKVGHSQSE